MSVISIFSGTFCRAEDVIKQVSASTGFAVISDAQVVAAASAHSGIPEGKLRRAFAAKTSVFNKFTREKECMVAYLKLAMAEIVSTDKAIVSGYCGQLLPGTISHLLRVALVADLKYRQAVAAKQEGWTEKEALKRIRSHDENCLGWFEFLHGAQTDCLEPSLYDLFIPMNKTTVEQASALVEENIFKNIVRTTTESQKAVGDFRLAAEVEVSLAVEGHNVEVEARETAITLRINKHVLMLGRLEEELKSIVMRIPGVQSVTVKTGKNYHQANIYRKHDFNTPSRVLLVDDERDLAQTLSERLEMRDMGSAVAYDGASALQMVEEDDPEVMIIDLKMPDIDGLEVLRKVKQTRPQIEVIILTGHGSDADKEQCMRLGAFGYLQKPVDIDKLSEMLKKAHEKIHRQASTKPLDSGPTTS